MWFSWCSVGEIIIVQSQCFLMNAKYVELKEWQHLLCFKAKHFLHLRDMQITTTESDNLSKPSLFSIVFHGQISVSLPDDHTFKAVSANPFLFLALNSWMASGAPLLLGCLWLESRGQVEEHTKKCFLLLLYCLNSLVEQGAWLGTSCHQFGFLMAQLSRIRTNSNSQANIWPQLRILFCGPKTWPQLTGCR